VQREGKGGEERRGGKEGKWDGAMGGLASLALGG